MKKWKPERRDGLLLLGIGLGAAVGRRRQHKQYRQQW